MECVFCFIYLFVYIWVFFKHYMYYTNIYIYTHIPIGTHTHTSTDTYPHTHTQRQAQAQAQTFIYTFVSIYSLHTLNTAIPADNASQYRSGSIPKRTDYGGEQYPRRDQSIVPLIFCWGSPPSPRFPLIFLPPPSLLPSRTAPIPSPIPIVYLSLNSSGL